ncbi:YcxB family protein [Epilithonimonas xixisoli]|uniref:YcxB-like protein n=1 Tax=Epilithonimonas xixisoli TaxID=1476462 RepID=A0A4R8IA61_9FLAO|nr:YcxB family protein [Epilithonimonas xixisoli]TDX86420.1 YcxB-like protein [Epilithonimonas xixisoli]
MKIAYKIEQSEYIKLMFYQTYKRPIFIYVSILGFIFLIFIIKDLFLYKTFDDYTSIFIAFFSLIFYPILLYVRFRNFYKSHKILGLKTFTEISNERFRDEGEGFEAKILWKNVYKVKELKNWILVYHNSTAYGFLPKRTMTKTQIEEFRNIIIGNNLKADLRKD